MCVVSDAPGNGSSHFRGCTRLDYIVIVVTAMVLDTQIKGDGLSFSLFLSLPRQNSPLDVVFVCVCMHTGKRGSNRNLSSFIRKHLFAKLKFNFSLRI